MCRRSQIQVTEAIAALSGSFQFEAELIGGGHICGISTGNPRKANRSVDDASAGLSGAESDSLISVGVREIPVPISLSVIKRILRGFPTTRVSAVFDLRGVSFSKGYIAVSSTLPSAAVACTGIMRDVSRGASPVTKPPQARKPLLKAIVPRLTSCLPTTRPQSPDQLHTDASCLSGIFTIGWDEG